MDETVPVIVKVIEAATGFVVSETNADAAIAELAKGSQLQNYVKAAQFLLPPQDDPAFDYALNRISVYFGVRESAIREGMS